MEYLCLYWPVIIREYENDNEHVCSKAWVQTNGTPFFLKFLLSPNGTKTQCGAGLCGAVRRAEVRSPPVDAGSGID